MEDCIYCKKENWGCCYVRLHFLSCLRFIFLQEKIKKSKEELIKIYSRIKRGY